MKKTMQMLVPPHQRSPSTLQPSNLSPPYLTTSSIRLTNSVLLQARLATHPGALFPTPYLGWVLRMVLSKRLLYHCLLVLSAMLNHYLTPLHVHLSHQSLLKIRAQRLCLRGRLTHHCPIWLLPT